MQVGTTYTDTRFSQAGVIIYPVIEHVSVIALEPSQVLELQQ